MRRTKTVFDSESEARLFHELDGRWCPRLRLLPQLPLSKLIKLDERTELSLAKRHFFYSTDVDYTFCWPDGRPWLSVEFDGRGGGFTRARDYVPRTRCDPQRARKLGQKVQWCNTCDYPLLVVSFDETEPLDPDAEPLTMLDGIVGQLLSRVRVGELINERYAEQEAWLNDLSPYEREDVIADMVVDADVDAEFEEDLLTRAVAEQAERCYELGVFISLLSTDPWLYDPPIPAPEWPITVSSPARTRARHPECRTRWSKGEGRHAAGFRGEHGVGPECRSRPRCQPGHHRCQVRPLLGQQEGATADGSAWSCCTRRRLLIGVGSRSTGRSPASRLS